MIVHLFLNLVFSNSIFLRPQAGLDLTQMYGAKKEFLEEFWYTFQEVWLTLYGTHLATVAAMNGHALAGGCIISLACDYRTIAQGVTIGLNEAAFGLVAPPWTIQMMIDVIGRRQAEKALSLGKVFGTEEAFSLGLVDKVIPTGSDTKTEAEKDIVKWTKAPGRAATKLLVRKTLLEVFLLYQL